MGLDLNFIPSTNFQEYMVDKATGAPLAAGVVTFYKDNARTELKPVFRITGTPPNYTYVELPNPLTLSAVGTVQDGSGNDVIPYFFPFDGDGNIELYFFTVENSGAVLQWTREGQPNVGVSGGDEDQFINYITNGQFDTHNSIAETPTRQAGEITLEVTSVAPGNWEFSRSAASTASDSVFFNRFGSPTTNPPDSPRYEIQVQTVTPDVGDTKKWLVVFFRDVNTFASDTAQYTFSFAGKSVTSTPVSTLINKHFGVGGSPDEEIPLQVINLTSEYKVYNIPVIFESNEGDTIGEGNDDTVALVISLPTSAVLDVQFTNFVLTPGDVTLSGFPITPVADVSAEALAGTLPMPDFDGQFLGLPIVLGTNGLAYDDSAVGSVLLYPVFGATPAVPPRPGYLLADGHTYDVDEYSIEGIPFRRLYNNQIIDASNGISVNGSGLFFLTAEPFAAGVIDLAANSGGTTNAIVDGAIPTGFTFLVIVADPFRERITCVGGGSITAGAYFKFWNPDSFGPDLFVAWFTVDGVGTQPVEVGTFRFIKVEVASSDTAAQVASKLMLTINRTYIKVLDLRGYFLRFTDDGAGRDPDAATRTAANTGSVVTGDQSNTVEAQSLVSHTHGAVTTIFGNDPGVPSVGLARAIGGAADKLLGHLSDTNGIYTGGPPTSVFKSTMAATTVSATGNAENRPGNITLWGIIKY